MKKFLVIFFAFMMLALPVSAQKQQDSWPSRDWRLQVKEVIKTSPAMAHVNTLTSVNTDKVKDNVWHDIVFNPEKFSMIGTLNGMFNLTDTLGEKTVTEDTTLFISVSNLSVPWALPTGTDVTDPRFLVPVYEVGTMKIITSYTPSQKGGESDSTDQQVVADASSSNGSAEGEKSLDTDSSDDSTNVTWMVEDKMFTVELNGKDYVYALNPENGKWESQDPDAPKVIKAGDRKNDPSFVFDKHGDLVASSERNAYKFGMGDYAGFEKNYYRNALNGRPLGGGYGLMPMASAYYPSYAPMYGGGGWGNGFGYSGGGFSAGFGLNFGWTSGCSYVDPYYCAPNRYSSGGAAIWNGYNHVGINWVGSGVGWSADNSGYYDDGCGGCKSNAVVADSYTTGETEEFYDLASAETKSSPVAPSHTKSAEQETFYDLKSGSAVANMPKEKVVTAQSGGDRKTLSTSRFENIPATGNVARSSKAPAGNTDNTSASVNSRLNNISATSARGVKEPAVVSGGRNRVGAVNKTPRENENVGARVQNAAQRSQPGRNRSGYGNPPTTTQRGVTTSPVRGNTNRSVGGAKPMNRGGVRTSQANRPQATTPVRAHNGGGRSVRPNPSTTRSQGAAPMRKAPQQRQARSMRQASPAQKRR